MKDIIERSSGDREDVKTQNNVNANESEYYDVQMAA